MTMNPSHILIARNSRGHNSQPSASLSSPIETHAAAAGIFRSGGLVSPPPWEGQAGESSTDVDATSELSSADEFEEEPIELDETFTRTGKLPGNVKIVVQGTTFWAHKEVLYFASPFFEAALSGNWAETSGGRPQSVSSIITISQPPHVATPDGHVEKTLAELSQEIEIVEATDDEFEADVEGDGTDLEDAEKTKAREASLQQLQSNASSPSSSYKGKWKVLEIDSHLRPRSRVTRHGKHAPDAVIVLKEEKAATFHDFLRYVYPHLVCTITWNNVEGLMNISHKLTVPSLQRECLTFLLTHAAGKPIKAMRIAELFEEEELYRESSRFVLDNPGGWPDQELSTLSPETLLKLEKRRTWFLERVLKLGLTQIAKEYQCCSTCPDPPTCARLLDEKWRQAYQAVFRFGPCQPSIVFRYLRTLEAVTPPLSLTHLSCQTHAKAFTATLFDRMFSLGLRGSGADAQPGPLSSRVATVAGASALQGPRRHFLYCSLKNEAQAKPKRSREL
ncbi:hypothetical protein BDY19DRAFT_967807 [Irpex rosettiformis]|uniref:Uncharacterized protein n=1 Tax=Irpex rosettiformis TaxID=378272 RepID=A0ACB8TT10_9APHY|nr:hypothetical protein BDY19DRAFT_967807 [Irpex rosettiformis]